MTCLLRELILIFNLKLEMANVSLVFLRKTFRKNIIKLILTVSVNRVGYTLYSAVRQSYMIRSSGNFIFSGFFMTVIISRIGIQNLPLKIVIWDMVGLRRVCGLRRARTYRPRYIWEWLVIKLLRSGQSSQSEHQECLIKRGRNKVSRAGSRML